ncbi:MAG: acetyl-CoA carboxylase biotin carboxyl carrier protein [Vicinamibacterales bacterium]
MDFDEIKQILEMMREHELVEFELEREDFKVRLRKAAGGTWAASGPPSHQGYVPQAFAPPPVPPATAAVPVLTVADEDVEFAVVKSPIVGTFYRSPEPGAKPFADVGETVKKGQVLCIIEAMKLMNEINADVDGEVVKVYVESGQAVQYGERLFAIKPS